jgi:selenocysteine-specific elongation factor
MQNSGSLTEKNHIVSTSSEEIAYFTVATAGHVDHGKTSLIKGLSGVDPDRLKEEKERQMTTDLGYAHLFLTPTLGLGFIDVPGHGKFLKNMLSGVGGIDLALLVVAANEGPMPQTRQHLEILKYLGVGQIIVVVTKVDLVDASEVNKTIEQMQALMASHNLAAVDFVPVSCLSGKGIDELKASLQKHLTKMPKRDASGFAFLPIDRAFKKEGFGVVVTGTLVNGKLRTGEQIFIQPGNGQARIRRLETFGKVVETARAGQRLAVNLVLKQDLPLSRGQVLLGNDRLPSKVLVASLEIADSTDNTKQLRQLSASPVTFYHGTAASHGRINWIEAVDQKQWAKDQIKAVALISLETAVVSNVQDRFVVRLPDDTIGGGKILLQEKPRWLTRQKLLAVAPLLYQGKFKEALFNYLQACPLKMAKVDQITHFIPSHYVQDLPGNLDKDSDLVVLGKWIISCQQKRLLEDNVCASLKEQGQWASNDVSIEPSVSMESLRANVLGNLDRDVFQFLIKDMATRKIVDRDGDNLQIFGYSKPNYQLSNNALTESILSILDLVPCLEIAAVASQCQAKEAEFKLALKQLTQENKAAIFAQEFAASQASLVKAHIVLSKLWQTKHDINPGDFRQALGTSRKYAMALLEYFDNQQITRRLPGGRVLLRAFQVSPDS